MHSDMSKETKDQVLARLRRRYATAGAAHKAKLLDQAVELLGYHRKAAIRALRRAQPKPTPQKVHLVLGRPKTYDPERLLPILKPIWFGAFQPCGSRLHALLPEWLPAYELDHRRIDPDLRQCLLKASARTLDRLIGPLRVGLARRGGTRPGSLLRQSIPIRGTWTEEGPGWLEMDTVALCGGALDDRHLWMLDAVDIRTDWTELRALENRGQRSTLEQIAHLEACLPFALLGLDSDNGGEFINHHLVAYLGQRPKPVLFTRGRPYRKNDNARVEQRNWTHVRQHFGYERYDNPQVAPLMNSLCQGPLGQLLNHFLPTHLLKEKRRKGKRTVRVYGPALTPYARVLAAAEVSAAKKAELQALHEQLNPFALARVVEQQKKAINSQRLLRT
jgi:PAS domain-containing protein